MEFSWYVEIFYHVHTIYLGHQIVAKIAETKLSSSARLQISQILNGSSISSFAGIFFFNWYDLSGWADEIRSDPEFKWTQRLHYTSTKDDPPNSCTLNLNRDCSDNQCIVFALFDNFQILRDRNKHDIKAIQMALKFVVHFAGDIHQPLHNSGKNRGGNGLIVQFDSVPTNLHSVWDDYILNVWRQDILPLYF